MSQRPGLELSQDVLYGIAQLALEGVEGVRTITPPTRVGEFLTGRRAKGIEIERLGDEVTVSLTVAMTYGERIPKVAAAAQRAVREAVGSMTGLAVRTVDVQVEAIDVPTPAPGTPGAPVRASGRRTRPKGAGAAKASGKGGTKGSGTAERAGGAKGAEGGAKETRGKALTDDEEREESERGGGGGRG